MKQFEDGDPCFAPMLNALFAAFRGTAVMDGCEASATGTSRAVSITAGSVQINGEVIAVGGGSVTLDAGSTFDRYDLVSVNASGSKIVTKGATKRKCPTQPANTCLLAIVFVPAGATVIATGNVYDARMLVPHVAVGSLSATGVIRTSDVTCVGNTNILFLSTPSNTVQASSTNVLEGNISEWQTAAKFLMPSNVLRGGIRIRAQVKQTYVPGSYSSPLTQIFVNGVNVGELGYDSGTGWKGASKDIYDDGMWGSIVEIKFMSDQGLSNKECGIRNCSICATFSRLPTSETPVTQTLV
jgi:hypothetical protein